jgi:hypothetical protein
MYRVNGMGQSDIWDVNTGQYNLWLWVKIVQEDTLITAPHLAGFFFGQVGDPRTTGFVRF